MTVPSQEMATFLGNHLDEVLQQSGQVFLNTVAAVQPFRAGCALMDILNMVESVQDRIRTQLEERNRTSNNRKDIGTEVIKVRVVSLYLLYSLYSHLPIHQNPFLCFFVDIYTSSLMDDSQQSERFVVSVILTGDGEELAPSSPSELMAIAQEVDPRHVNLVLLNDILPQVPAEDQVLLGMSWSDCKPDSRDARCPRWKSLDLSDWLPSSGTGRDEDDGGQSLSKQELISDDKTEHLDDEEGELEEWEIEAEKHFQESEDVIPAPPKPTSKPKSTVEPVMSRHNINLIMEQAVIQPLSFEEEQFMLSQFAVDADKVHIPLPPTDAISGIVDNNPTIAFNLLLYLIQLSKEMGLADVPANGGAGKNGNKGIAGYPEPSMVDVYLDTMIHTKRLTLHSLEVVNRLTTATTVSPRFLHGYIENAVRCCELVDDKVGQARVVRMLCVFLQSLLRNNVITIAGYFHVLQNFCIQFSRVKEVATLFQTLVEYQRKMDAQSPSHHTPPMPPPTVRTGLPTQSVSVPSTPTTESSQRASWLANSGSISHIKTSLSKHNSMNGFSTPGALSQFIHPGPSSPAAGGQIGSNGGVSSAFGQSMSNGSGLYIKTHHKHSSQHSSASGSLFSSPTVMSASVNAFNTGLGNPTSLTLNGSTSSSNNYSNNSHHTNGGQGPSSSSSHRAFAGSSWGQSHETLSEFDDEDLEAALRASLKDVEVHSQHGSSLSFSSKSRIGGGHDQGSGTASSTLQTPDNGLANSNDRTRRRVVASSSGAGRREKTDGPRNRMVPLKNRNP